MDTHIRTAAALSCLVMAVTLADAVADDDRKRDHDEDRAELSVEAGDKDYEATVAKNDDGDVAMDADADADADVDVDVDADRDFGDRMDDAALTAEVKTKLMLDEHAEALNTNVDTENGVVTLSGIATSEEAKAAAEEVAAAVDGVRSVNNELEVDPDWHEDVGASGLAQAGASGTVSAGEETLPTGPVATDPDDEDSLASEGSDAWITAKVKAGLLAEEGIDATEIDVDVEEGVVRLSGEVDDEDEKDLVIELAKNTRGVRDVDASGLAVIG